MNARSNSLVAERFFELEQLVVVVEPAEHLDDVGGEAGRRELAVGPRHEQPADPDSLLAIVAVDAGVGRLFDDGDDVLVSDRT